MDLAKNAAEMFGVEPIKVYEAGDLDDAVESDALLAREGGRGILESEDDDPQFVVEANSGFVVVGETHAVFLGDDGEVQVESLDEAKRKGKGKHADRMKDQAGTSTDNNADDAAMAEAVAVSVSLPSIFAEDVDTDGLEDYVQAAFDAALQTSEGLEFLSQFRSELYDSLTEAEDERAEAILEDARVLSLLSDVIARMVDEGQIPFDSMDPLRQFDEAVAEGDLGAAIALAYQMAESNEVKVDLEGTGLSEASMMKLMRRTGPGSSNKFSGGKGTSGRAARRTGGKNPSGASAGAGGNPGNPKRPYNTGSTLGKGASGSASRLRAESDDKDVGHFPSLDERAIFRGVKQKGVYLEFPSFEVLKKAVAHLEDGGMSGLRGQVKSGRKKLEFSDEETAKMAQGMLHESSSGAGESAGDKDPMDLFAEALASGSNVAIAYKTSTGVTTNLPAMSASAAKSVFKGLQADESIEDVKVHVIEASNPAPVAESQESDAPAMIDVVFERALLRDITEAGAEIGIPADAPMDIGEDKVTLTLSEQAAKRLRAAYPEVEFLEVDAA